MDRPYAPLIDMLKDKGLRPTRQRLGLARLLFGAGDRHVTAESLHEEALHAGTKVSLATIYNTLHQFTEVGLLREVLVDSNRSYFDTNVVDHHHIYHEDSGRLEDVPFEAVSVGTLPEPPEGTRISRVDVVIRVTGRN